MCLRYRTCLFKRSTLIALLSQDEDATPLVDSGSLLTSMPQGAWASGQFGLGSAVNA